MKQTYLAHAAHLANKQREHQQDHRTTPHRTPKSHHGSAGYSAHAADGSSTMHLRTLLGTANDPPPRHLQPRRGEPPSTCNGFPMYRGAGPHQQGATRTTSGAFGTGAAGTGGGGAGVAAGTGAAGRGTTTITLNNFHPTSHNSVESSHNFPPSSVGSSSSLNTSAALYYNQQDNYCWSGARTTSAAYSAPHSNYTIPGNDPQNSYSNYTTPGTVPPPVEDHYTDISTPATDNYRMGGVPEASCGTTVKPHHGAFVGATTNNADYTSTDLPMYNSITSSTTAAFHFHPVYGATSCNSNSVVSAHQPPPLPPYAPPSRPLPPPPALNGAVQEGQHTPSSRGDYSMLPSALPSNSDHSGDFNNFHMGSDFNRPREQGAALNISLGEWGVATTGRRRPAGQRAGAITSGYGLIL